LRKERLLKVMVLPFIITGILTVAGCGSAAANNISNDPSIIEVVAEHSTLYPLGNTNITCSALSKDGSKLNYRWVSSDGTITGSGAKINWEAPQTYGDFHIMVIVDDGKGHSNTGTTTVTVIVRDPTKCCK
jgi:hypothetical protein